MSLNEFEIIRHYFSRPGASPGVSLGIGDDAAVLQPSAGFDLVVAADMLNVGVHFPLETSAHSIGYKALAVNLSDMAAMGARPRWFTMTLSLPEPDEKWLEAFSAGLFEIADGFGLALVGGDTTRGPLSISIQIFGEVETGTALRRDGARPGDTIYVSGTLGDAAAGLRQLEENADIVLPELRARLDYPSPRVELGNALRGIASSCIDISDGLLADLQHVLDASAVGARLQVDRIPLSEATQAAGLDDPVRLALTGGDDYELCFTVPADKKKLLKELALSTQLRLTPVGEIEPGKDLILSGADLDYGSLVERGFNHFVTEKN